MKILRKRLYRAYTVLKFVGTRYIASAATGVRPNKLKLPVVVADAMYRVPTMLAIPILLIIFMMYGCVGDPEPEMRSKLKVGDTLPQFSIIMNDGETLTTEMLRGSESMIVLFTTACPDCRAALPRIQEYSDAHLEVRVVCISRSESAADIEALWDSEGLTLPYSAQPDASVYSLFATAGVPRVYMADTSLRVTGIYF